MNSYPDSFSILHKPDKDPVLFPLVFPNSPKVSKAALEVHLKKVDLLRYWYDRMRSDLITLTRELTGLRAENEFLLRTCRDRETKEDDSTS